MGSGTLTKEMNKLCISETQFVRYMPMHDSHFLPECVMLYMSNTVNDKQGYREVVERVVEVSMQKAVEEEKQRPDYISTGEVKHIITYLKKFCYVYVYEQV